MGNNELTHISDKKYRDAKNKAAAKEQGGGANKIITKYKKSNEQ